uniref:Uncharacterized protein n=1 Tax=Anguilla anguilla TaxID=7936 RepID=A0A0E9X1R9_ANGAN
MNFLSVESWSHGRISLSTTAPVARCCSSSDRNRHIIYAATHLAFLISDFTSL